MFKNFSVTTLILSLTAFLPSSTAFAQKSTPGVEAPKSSSIWPFPEALDLNPASTTKVYDIAVIGGGSAGTMAAKRSALNNDSTLWITGERKTEKQARGMWVPKLSNTPAFEGLKRPIVDLRKQTLADLATGPQSSYLDVVQKSIDGLEKSGTEASSHFVLTDSAGVKYKAKHVILATGAMDTQPLIGGSVKAIVSFSNRQQAIYCLRCDGHLSANKKNSVVIGSSDDAAAGAIILKERYNLPSITLLTNGAIPAWSSANAKLLKAYGIKVNTKEMLALADKAAKELTEVTFTDDSKIPADFAVVSLGMRINNALAKQMGATLDETGYIVGDPHGLTNINGLYVAGDVKSGTRKQIYVAWDTAVRAAEAINKIMRLEKRKAMLAGK